MNIGDKIKSFTVMDIVKSYKNIYANGKKSKVIADYLLLLSDKGQQRVLELGKTKLSESAMGRFGSGWAWLYLDEKKSLQIGSTPNQDNPLMDISPIKGTPLLGIDIWEHAYYLKYQNRRAEYVSNWFNLVNWKFVEDMLVSAR